MREVLCDVRLTADESGITVLAEIEKRIRARISGGDGTRIISTSSGSKSATLSQEEGANLDRLRTIAKKYQGELGPEANGTVEDSMLADDELQVLYPGDCFRTDFSTCRYS